MLFLLGKLNKTNEDQIIAVNIYWKRYPLCYINFNTVISTYIYICDTLGIQGFLRFSGELVSFVELGQPDLIKVF